jgi:2'-5' RNA ligase
MQPSLVRMPGYALREYLLVLNPHEALRERIARKREKFRSSFGLPDGPVPAHLILARFHQRLMDADRTMGQLKQVAMGIAPFRVSLRDFGSQPDHSIVIRTDRTPALRQLSADLRGLHHMMRPDPEHPPRFIADPHIPLSARLKPQQYDKAWADYGQRHFSASFIADAMLVLSRPPGERRYQVAARLDFQNLPVATKQGELFPS